MTAAPGGVHVPCASYNSPHVDTQVGRAESCKRVTDDAVAVVVAWAEA